MEQWLDFGRRHTRAFAAVHEPASDGASRQATDAWLIYVQCWRNPGPSRPAPRDGSGAKDPKTSIGNDYSITLQRRCSCADASQSDIGGTLANRVP